MSQTESSFWASLKLCLRIKKQRDKTFRTRAHYKPKSKPKSTLLRASSKPRPSGLRKGWHQRCCKPSTMKSRWGFRTQNTQAEAVTLPMVLCGMTVTYCSTGNQDKCTVVYSSQRWTLLSMAIEIMQCTQNDAIFYSNFTRYFFF